MKPASTPVGVRTVVPGVAVGKASKILASFPAVLPCVATCQALAPFELTIPPDEFRIKELSSEVFSPAL